MFVLQLMPFSRLDMTSPVISVSSKKIDHSCVSTNVSPNVEALFIEEESLLMFREVERESKHTFFEVERIQVEDWNNFCPPEMWMDVINVVDMALNRHDLVGSAVAGCIFNVEERKRMLFCMIPGKEDSPHRSVAAAAD